MSKFAIKEVADVTFFDIETGKPVIFFDTLKVSTIENEKLIQTLLQLNPNIRIK
mgnify:CR=1 FL=1